MKFNLDLSKAFLIEDNIEEIDGFYKILTTEQANVFISKDYEYYKLEMNNKTAILMGYCYDIRDADISNEKVLEELLKLEDKDSWYKFMDYLNGRFVIILSVKEKLYVHSDATNMKPIFYNEKHKIVASHEYIIKEILVMIYSEEIADSLYIRKNALDWSDTNHIYKLSPSVELEYYAFTMTRIFPRNNKPSYTVSEAIQEMNSYIKETIKWLSNQNNKKFSLTGGVDSRISLSIVKPIVDQIDFFTYMKENKALRSESMRETYYNDQKIANDIAYNLNLNHEMFFIPTSVNEKEYINTLKKTMSSQHSYQLSHYLENRKEFNNALHIKSTIQSIGKSSFPTSLYDENNIENLLIGIRKWVPDEMKKKNNYELLYKHVKDYLTRIDLNITRIYNYHVLDLVFLESRLGNFQSNITQETDKTLEVFNLFNSRKFIELFLSVPLEDRQNQEIGKQLIENHWPVLDYFALNSSPSLKEKHYNLKKNVRNSIGAKMFKKHMVLPVSENNVIIRENNGQYSVEIADLPLAQDKIYKVQFINYKTSNQMLSVRSGYNNEKGRGVIQVKVNGIERDIVDLYNGIKMRINGEEYLDVEFSIRKRKEKNSWKNASRIFIDFK